MSRFAQYYTTLCANLLSIGYGQIIGWASPILPVLRSENTPLPFGKLTDDNISWLAAIANIGSVVGCIITAIAADRYGRKVAMYMTAIPCLLNWILLIYASNFLQVFFARFIAGLVGGGTYMVIPLYVTEIASDKIRGELGAYIQFLTNFGIVLSFILGAYLDYYVISYVFVIFPVIFILGFWFVPETPAFLISKYKVLEAEKSLKFFRGYKSESEMFSIEFLRELADLKAKVKKRSVKTKLCLSDFTTRSAVYAIAIGIVLFTAMQANGSFVIMVFIGTIFKEAGTTISPNISAIIVGVVFLAGTCTATFLVDRVGRRPLLIWSCLTSGIFIGITGSYFFLLYIGYNVKDYSWIAISCIAGYYFTTAWGVLALPFVVLGEMLPIKIRGIISMILRIFLSLTGFLLVKYFYAMRSALELHGCMWLFSGIIFLTGLVVFFWLPETKGKSVDEIIKLLEKSERLEIEMDEYKETIFKFDNKK